MTGPLKSGQQEKFAQHVASGMSQADAYRSSYKATKMKPETIWEKASILASSGKVRARIKEIQAIATEKAGLKAAEILEEVRRIALSDIGGIMHTDGRVKLPHELDPATRAAVQSFKIDESGRIEYKFCDKNAALDKAMKHLGLYKEDNVQKPVALIREVRLVPLLPERRAGDGSAREVQP